VSITRHHDLSVAFIDSSQFNLGDGVTPQCMRRCVPPTVCICVANTTPWLINRKIGYYNIDILSVVDVVDVVDVINKAFYALFFRIFDVNKQ
jgi:hypothetical protein